MKAITNNLLHHANRLPQQVTKLIAKNPGNIEKAELISNQQNKLSREDLFELEINNKPIGTNLFYKPSLIQQNQIGLNQRLSNNFSNKVEKMVYFYSSKATDGLTGGRSVDVTSDKVFKGIFSDEGRIKNFLQNVLVGDGKILPQGTKIEEIQYIKTEHIQNKIPEDSKKSVFDLQIKTNKGLYIIEMQKTVSQDYLKRMEFYNATAYSQQQIKGVGSSSMKDYVKALPIVTISVIDGKMFADNVPCVSYHVNVERKTQESHMDAFSYVFIELGKFGDDKYDQSNINAEEKDWFDFMKKQDLNKHYDNEEVNNAVKFVVDVRDNKYDDYVRAQITEVADIKEKEEKFNKGKAEGKLEIAREMLSDGESIEKIMKFTKLTKQEITDLRK